VLVLSRADVRRLLDLDQLLDALERVFVELSAGRASVPPRIAAETERGLLAAMPGYADGILETKLVSVFAGNHEVGLPSHQATIAVFDDATGKPLALMDGTEITAVRTGAASAVATRVLARPDARILAVLGAAAAEQRMKSRAASGHERLRCRFTIVLRILADAAVGLRHLPPFIVRRQSPSVSEG
jgi:ornithine cyclodeaminase/alanine dehydrogenase-like protein (mu-crystallin family)